MFEHNLGMQDLRLLVSGGQDGSLSVLHLASGHSYLHISLHTAEVPLALPLLLVQLMLLAMCKAVLLM